MQPLLVSTARIHDTCGVHNLHGMPAVLSAIFSAIFASLASSDNYKDTLYDVFPAMNWKNSTYAHNATFIIGVTCLAINMRGFSILCNAPSLFRATLLFRPHFRREVYIVDWSRAQVLVTSDNLAMHVCLPQGFGRSASEQAGFQLIGVTTTIAFAVIGGLLTGAILNMPVMRNLDKDEQHDDEIYWEVPDDFKTV